MPNDPNIPSLSKISNDTINMLAGPSQSPQTSASMAWWKPKPRYSLESLQRFLAYLMLSFALGVFFCIVLPSTRHNAIFLLGEAGKLSLTHMGTTALAVGAGFMRFIQTRWRHWRSDMKKFWADIGKGASVTIIIWSGLFVFCLFEAARNDHQAQSMIASDLAEKNSRLAAENSRLANNDIGTQIKIAQDEAQRERDDARRWQVAYERMSHGETHPDRILDNEDMARLTNALKNFAKYNPDKKRTIIDFGMLPDQEVSHLGWQLYRIFHDDARWPIKPPTQDFPYLSKELRDRFMNNRPIGIVIWTGDRDIGDFLYRTFRSVGLESTVNPNILLPTVPKRTVVWVVNKQMPSL